MKTLFLASALFCVTSTVFGQGAAVIIKQRAKEAAGRPTTPIPAPVAPQPGVAAPAPQSGAQITAAALNKIVADLATIKTKSPATQDLKDKLATDLGAVALGANKPSSEAIQALANAVSDAIAGKKLSAADQTSLARGLAVALGGNAAQMDAAIQSVKDALVLGNASDASVKLVAEALTGLAPKAK